MTSEHTHQTESDDRYSQETWDARYGESDRLWSGNPNARLVEHVTGMAPGTALDVGAGEGGDSIWLASQGWTVTALDISTVALGRVAEHARESGVAERVTTLHHDLLHGGPVPGTYDLVSAHFWHPPTDVFADLYRSLGALVRPGGSLLVVGHHPDGLPAGAPDPHGHAHLMFTPEQVVEVLATDGWEIRVAASPTRANHRHEGPETLTDSVVLAVRG